MIDCIDRSLPQFWGVFGLATLIAPHHMHWLELSAWSGLVWLGVMIALCSMKKYCCV